MSSPQLPFRTATQQTIVDDKRPATVRPSARYIGLGSILQYQLHLDLAPQGPGDGTVRRRRCRGGKSCISSSSAADTPLKRLLFGLALSDFSWTRFLAKPHLFRKFRSLLGVVRRDHRIVRRQPPLCTVRIRRETLASQMPFQRAIRLPVFEADDVVIGDRLLDGNP